MLDVRPAMGYLQQNNLFGKVISHGRKCSGSSGSVCFYAGTTLPYSFDIIWSYCTLSDSGSTEAVCHSPMYVCKSYWSVWVSLLHENSRNFDTSLETNSDKPLPHTLLKLGYTWNYRPPVQRIWLKHSGGTWTFIVVLWIEYLQTHRARTTDHAWYVDCWLKLAFNDI